MGASAQRNDQKNKAAVRQIKRSNDQASERKRRAGQSKLVLFGENGMAGDKRKQRENNER